MPLLDHVQSKLKDNSFNNENNRYLSLFSISLVLASTVGMCLNTMPSFRHYSSSEEPIDNPYLALLEAVCISWFTVEYLLRLAGAPQKMSFIKQTMNIIDVLAIAPYYISLLFEDPELDLRIVGGQTNR